MSIKKIILSVYLISTILSCKQNKYGYNLAFDEKSEFEISLDSLTPADTKMMQFFDDENDNKSLAAFAMLNFDNQVINLHNDKGVKFRDIGLLNIDSTLSKVSGFYFIDTDSLLVYSEKSRNMKLVSCSNKFPPVLLFNLDSLRTAKITQLDVAVTSKTPMLYKDGTLYLVGRAMLNNEISHPQAKEVISAFSFDINTKKANFISTFKKAWAERYWHHEQYYVNHTFIPGKQTIVYSLAMKDSVILYNIQTKSQTKTSILSEELGNEDDMIPKAIYDPSTIGSYEDLMQYLDKPRYGEIIFDKYRNVYYRFVSAGNVKRVTYLVITDRNFKKIGEAELPEHYLPGAGFFITKEGLFLKEGNKVSEDKIVFKLFKLNKNS